MSPKDQHEIESSIEPDVGSVVDENMEDTEQRTEDIKDSQTEKRKQNLCSKEKYSIFKKETDLLAQM